MALAVTRLCFFFIEAEAGSSLNVIHSSVHMIAHTFLVAGSARIINIPLKITSH